MSTKGVIVLCILFIATMACIVYDHEGIHKSVCSLFGRKSTTSFSLTGGLTACYGEVGETERQVHANIELQDQWIKAILTSAFVYLAYRELREIEE